MAPKRKKETKESTNPEQKGKPDKSKGLVNEEPSAPSNPDVPKRWVNPLPLITGKEVLTPLAKGEHQFISILNAEGNPSIFTRLQKLENVLDNPYRPPSVIEHYDGSSCDCYFKHELTKQHDLCEKCEEIWRRWNWKWTPAPPIEIDPYQNFLCVGDIDTHFQPVRGDIVIFHPVGPQAMVGLKAKWGFVSSFSGQKGMELNQHDVVVRLGSFSNSKNVVTHIPYDKVEVRAMTKDKQWRFLGGQAALVREEPIKPPPPLKPIAPLESKDSKNKKKDKKKDSKQVESQEVGGTEKSSKKKKSQKEKKDKKGGKEKKEKDKNSEGQTTEIQIGNLPEFTLDGIPDLFNIIQKVPDSFIRHPGEAIFRPYRPSLTCNYKYSKPGMKCGLGEFLPQFGDIVIREPQAWMHDEWGDKKKRPKGSMVKWYKPSPWKRELKQGMLLLRPYIDKCTQLLDTIPQCEYTPLMWSQWGVAELYQFDGRIGPPVEPIEIDSETPREAVNAAGEQDERDKKRDKKGKNREKKVEHGDKNDDAKSKGKEKQEEKKKKEKSTKDDTKASKTSKRNGEGDNRNNSGENIGENKEEPKDDMLWKYWGRSTHYFDEPYQFWAEDKFCRDRHLRDVQKLEHLDFFVEDTGVESDLEHAPKVEVVAPPQEPEGKKAKEKSDKSKDKKDRQKEGAATKKKKKT